MAWLDRIWSWLQLHPDVIWAITGASLLLLVVGFLALPLIIVGVRPDYLVVRGPRRHPVLVLVRNTLGAVVLLAGIAMLALPGQGLLTIVAGLMLLDFPGKRRLVLKLVRREGVRSWIDWIREKRGRPPLQVPDEEG